MTQPATSADAIEQVALGPKKVTVGTESVEQFTPAELREAAAYLAGQTAKTKKHFGIRMTRCIPPGCGS